MIDIRKAQMEDVSRIAEILVFTKRMNYRRIFRDDAVSFGEMQVLPLAREYLDYPHRLDNIWVYDDGFVKGMLHMEGDEVCELYVEPFFEGCGIGGRLLDFAIREFGARRLWVLEKNRRAQAFYQRHGFFASGAWQFEDGTWERIIEMVR